MAEATIKVKLDKATRFLDDLADNIKAGAQEGLRKSARGVHREAFDWLSGKGNSPGSYPVPVETGNLRRLLDWLEPGEKKSFEGDVFEAGELEAIIYNSAAYSDTIHKGEGSSAKFGPRQFLFDGYDQFDQGGRVQGTIEKEIAQRLPS